MTRTVSAKMGIKEGARAIFVNAPAMALTAIDLPNLEVAPRLAGKFDYIHLFATSRQELDGMFPTLKAHLEPTGMLWVYRHGLVESKTLSVDATWSAIKFTHPIEGKVYKNSYGQLPTQ